VAYHIEKGGEEEREEIREEEERKEKRKEGREETVDLRRTSLGPTFPQKVGRRSDPK
jgi:hypothetical protein